MKNNLLFLIFLILSFVCDAQFTFAQNWQQLGLDIDGEAAEDRSGFSLSLSSDGQIVAIGALYNDGSFSNAGHTRVYSWNETTMIWSQLGADIDGEALNDWSGYSVSLSSNGQILAVGAYRNDGNGGNSGHTRVYSWNGTTMAWDQLGADIDGDTIGDQSGTSVSLSSDGQTLAIGARFNDGNGTDSGHTRVYIWNGTTQAWVQLGQDIDGEAPDDQSGSSVSLSSDGQTLAIGATGNDGNGGNSGHTRVYSWNGTTMVWDQLGADIDGEAIGDQSGYSVSLSGDGQILAVGARSNDGNGTTSGHTRVFSWNGTTMVWDQLGADINGEAAGDQSGTSVSLSIDGQTLAVGAPNNDGNGIGSGHSRVFKWNGTTMIWDQLGADIDGEAIIDKSGGPVCLSGDGAVLAAGATFNDGNGTSSGHTRVFSFESMLEATIDSVNNLSCNGASDGFISISLSGGTPPYTLSLDSGVTSQSDSTFTNLVADSYTILISDANGNDTTINVTLTEPSPLVGSFDTIICNGATFTFNGNTYGNGILTGTEILTAANACDSTVTISITEQNASGTFDTTICNGATFVYNGTVYGNGLLNGTEVFTTTNGCDSTVSVAITETPILLGTFDTTICNGATFVYNGTVYGNGLLNGTEVFTTANGCDSTVRVSITETPILLGAFDTTICNGATFVYNGTVYGNGLLSGTEVFTTANGCDSTVSVAISETPFLSGAFDTTICNGATFLYNGTTYGDGTYTGTEIFTGAGGCDSTVAITVTEHDAISITSFSVTEESSIGATDGEITIVPAGGTGQLTITWSPSGQTGSNAIGLTTGNYTVTVTDEINCQYSETIFLDVEDSLNVAINLISIKALTIYPNPTTGLISISFETKDAKDLQFNVLNTIGEVVLSETATRIHGAINKTFDLSNILSGIYILQIRSGEGIINRKIAVSR